jgi:hypothetical protein
LEFFSVFSSQVGGYFTDQQEFTISQVEAQQVSNQLPSLSSHVWSSL